MRDYNESAGKTMLANLKNFEEVYSNPLKSVADLDHGIYANYLENEPLDENEDLRKRIFGLVFPVCLKEDFPELVKKVNVQGNYSRNDARINMDHLTASEKDKVRTNLTMRAFDMYTMWNWRKYKKIYSIDNTLINELSSSDNYQIRADVLRHLPFPCFYVNAKICSSIDGFFVVRNNRCLSIMYVNGFQQIAWFTIDYEDTDLKAFIKKHDKMSNDNLEYITQNKVSAGASDELVANALKAYVSPKDQSKVTNKSTLKDIMELVHEFQIHNESLMITILMYILSVEADISDPDRVKSVYTTYTKKGKKNKLYDLEEYPVGVNVGPAIKRFRVEAEKHRKEIMESKTGSCKCPHVRKAHWHHYWVGHADDRRLTVKWIAPCFINGYTDETKIANMIPMLG